MSAYKFALKTSNMEDKTRQLQNEVENWVNRTFNFIQLEVVNKFCDEQLYEYIVQPEPASVFLDWLDEQDNVEGIIKDYLVWSEMTHRDAKLVEYVKMDSTVKKSFIQVFGDDEWSGFVDWALAQYEDEINDFITEEENYPMWNTLFEFREGYYNNDSKTCMSVGLGVIEGLEPFNNILFMSSAGHSFYSAYWIPLYFALNETAREKYDGVDYSSI